MFFLKNININSFKNNKLYHLTGFMNNIFYRCLFITQIRTPDLKDLSLYTNKGFNGNDIV